MDSLSQMVLGSSVAYLVAGKQAPRLALLAGAVVATLPDLDVIVQYADPLQSTIQHRTWSHSWLVQTAISPLLAYTASLYLPKLDFKRWLWLIWLCLITHTLLDCFTVYGTGALWPLPISNFMQGSIFIIDPLYTLPLLAAAVVAWLNLDKSVKTRKSMQALDAPSKIKKNLITNKVTATFLISLCTSIAYMSFPRLTDLSRLKHEQGARKWVVNAMLVSCAYLVWGLTAQQMIKQRLLKQLAQDNIISNQVLVTPAPFNSLLWRVVAMQNDRYYEGLASVLDEDQTINLSVFDRNTANLAQLEQVPSFNEYAAFAHDFYTLENAEGQIIIKDLRMGFSPYLLFQFKIAHQVVNKVVAVPPQFVDLGYLPLPQLRIMFGFLMRRIFNQNQLVPRMFEA